MAKFLIGIIFIMAAGGWFLYNKNLELVELNNAYEVRDVDQRAAILAIQNQMETTQQAIQNLQRKNQEYETQMNEYLDVFRRHNVSKLASAKPGMIEKRFNDATKGVFDDIEEISISISSLND